MLALTAALVSLTSTPANTGANLTSPIKQAFVQNKGQWDSQARFLGKSKGLNMWVTETGFALDFRTLVSGESDSRLKGHVVKVDFVGSSGATYATGREELPGYVNFLKGDASQWVTKVPRFEEAMSANVLPGVDARYYFDNANLRYDVIVRPGANPDSVRMKYSGAQNIRVLPNGNLAYDTSLGTVEERGLFVYQTINGRKQQISASFDVKSDGTVGFNLGQFDRSKPVVIDPLVWAGYLGGSANDSVEKVATDNSGNVLAVGSTLSTDFPTTTGAYDVSASLLGDVIVSRVSANGNTLQWSTYIGGDAEDVGRNIASPGTGGAIITGATRSKNFAGAGTPLPRDLSTAATIPWDAFVTAVNSTGTGLAYSSRLGGSGNDYGNGIVAQSGSLVFLGGETASTNFPMRAEAPAERPVQRTYQGGTGDGWIAKVNLGTSNLTWSTFVGGSAYDTVNEVALQGSNVVAVGTTESSNLWNGVTVTNPGYDTALGGTRDAFIVGLNNNGNSALYRTYHGGTGTETGVAITTDTLGNMLITGNTNSGATNDFPLVVGFQRTWRQPQMAYVSRVDATASNLTFSTYYGTSTGNGLRTWATDIAIDPANVPVISGYTESPNIPTAGRDTTTTSNGGLEGFLARFGVAPGRLFYGSYLGGAANDMINGVTVDSIGTISFGGTVAADGFPVTTGAFDTTYAGGTDGVLGKFTTPVRITRIFSYPMIAPYRVPIEVNLDGFAQVNTTVVVASDNTFAPIAVPNLVVTRGTSKRVTDSPIQRLIDDITVNITGSLAGETVSNSFSVPAPNVNIGLTNSIVFGGTANPGTVTITDPASPTLFRPIYIALFDNATGDPLPTSIATVNLVTIAANTTSSGITVRTFPVTEQKTVKVAGPKGVFETFIIEPPFPTLLSLNRDVVVGGVGTTVTGTVELGGPAPTGGTVVTLASDNAAATVPASITIPAGQRKGTFTITSAGVPTDQFVTVSAAAYGTTTLDTYTIQAPRLASVGFVSNPIVRGRTNLGTVALTHVAPAGGLVVNLSVVNPATGVTVPVSVTVPAGSRFSPRFNITTDAGMAAPATATIRASLNGQDVDGSFTINP